MQNKKIKKKWQMKFWNLIEKLLRILVGVKFKNNRITKMTVLIMIKMNQTKKN